MEVADFIILVLLCVLFGAGVYMMWITYQGSSSFENFSANPSGISEEQSQQIIATGGQFYPNMRYKDRVISYRMESTCKLNKWESAQRAFAILSEKTSLKFYNSPENPQIRVFCSEIREESAERKGYFIAGEGGPTEVINSTVYAVILAGKIALYKDETCDEPKIALHEILHALGFDHVNNTGSIMNPVTNCNQHIDQYIVDEIERLYAVNSLPDLTIDRVIGSKNGRYMNFNISIINTGLEDAKNAVLDVYTDGKKEGHYSLGNIEIGTKKTLTVQNLAISWSVEKALFAVSLESGQEEIRDTNNKLEITLAK